MRSACCAGAQFRTDQKFRLGVLGILPLTVIYLLAGIQRRRTGRRSCEREPLLVYYAVLFFPVMLRQFLVYSESWRASWIFHAAPMPFDEIVVALKNTVVSHFLVPYLLLVMLLLGWLYPRPPLELLMHGLVIGLLSHALLTADLLVNPSLPFSQPTRQGTRSLALLALMVPTMAIITTIPFWRPYLYATTGRIFLGRDRARHRQRPAARNPAHPRRAPVAAMGVHELKNVMWIGSPSSSLTPFIPVIEHLQEAACLESADGATAVVNEAWLALFGAAGRLSPLQEGPGAAAWAPALVGLRGRRGAVGARGRATDDTRREFARDACHHRRPHARMGSLADRDRRQRARAPVAVQGRDAPAQARGVGATGAAPEHRRAAGRRASRTTSTTC